MPTVKITKAIVDKIPFTEKGQILFSDSELRGFYLVVGSQSKTYIAQKDIRGRSVRITIGRHGHFTPEQARKIAKEKLHLMAQGINPNVIEKETRAKEVTLREVLETYLATRKSLGERTKADYIWHVNKYLSDWMDKMMSQIGRDEISARHIYVGGNHGHRAANHVMHILRALFNFAHVTYDICEVNPVIYLSKTKAWFPQKRRKTYIKPHQLKAWWSGVQGLQNDTMRDFFTLLIFTGLRRSEAASLKWDDIDFKDKTITIAETKNGDALTLPVGEYLQSMFEARRKRYGNHVFVFPGTGEDGYLHEPKKGINRIIKASGVTFSCHDLRRTFITIAESLDISAYALKRLINHRSTDITGSYIIADAERLRIPVKKIEQFILEKVA